jgi:hypothetical protein
MIPLTAKIISPQHDWPDYELKAGHEYRVKNNDGVGRYISVSNGFLSHDSVYLDNKELRPEVMADFIVIE